MKRYFRTLTGNTLFKIGMGVTLTIVIASAVSYYLIYKEIEQRVLQHLSQYVTQRAKLHETSFLLAQDLHQVIKVELLEKLAQPPAPDALRRFDELFVQYPDGAVRSRPEHIGAPPYISAWIHKDVELTQELRRRCILFYDLTRQFTPSALVRFLDIYFVAPEGVDIGNDPADLPNWGINTPADWDMNQNEAYRMADPAHNPDRATVWSGVYFDEAWKTFLVSTGTPVDYQGRHVASIQNDIALDDLMASVLESDIEGASHSVFQADGRLIALKSKMRAIRASQGQYFIQDSGDPRLLSLFHAARRQRELPVSGYDSKADQYLAVSRLQGPSWYFATTMPGQLVRGQAFQSAQWVLWTGLVSLALVLAILAVLMRRQIALPLRRLLTATQQMRERKALVPLDTGRQDELGQLADAFVHTATSIEQQFEQRAQALRHEMDERKRAYEALHDSERRYHLVAEQTGHVLYDYDVASGKVLWAGPTRQVTGYTADEFREVDVTRWERLIHPDDRAVATTELARAQAELGKYLVEYRLRRADGSYVYMEDEGAFISNEAGQAVRMLGTLKDISERKQAMAAIQQAREAADSARVAADNANAAKSQFLANMSHELRTPLNGILGYAQLLSRDPSLGEKHRSRVQVMQRSGEHLLVLINDILDLARVESRKLERMVGDFDLSGLLQTVARESELKAAQKQLSFCSVFDPELPAVVSGDEHKLRQILSNLISNAIKFTQAGEVKLAVERQHERVLFAVSDTGCGIKPEDLTLLFQPFQQVGEHARVTEGTGLGLAISRTMVELLGGKLEVQSEFGKGSRFWFSVPLPESDAILLRTAPQRSVLGYEGARRRVLVVDDVEVNRAVLRDMLKPLGFDVAEAENGQAAIEVASTNKPDLILMDIRMPVMDGLEATRRIRRIDSLKEIIIIPISASAYAHHRDQCLAAGANDFLPKPFRQETLLELLRTHLELEFIYAADAEAPSQVSKVDGNCPTWVCPPAQELAVFIDLARRGEVKNILKRALQLEQSDARYAPFVAELRGLTQGIKLKELRGFLNASTQP